MESPCAHHGITMARPASHLKSEMVKPWTDHGDPWFRHEVTMVSSWAHHGLKQHRGAMHLPWRRHGLTINSSWTTVDPPRFHHGRTIDSPWTHHGLIMAPPWAHHDFTIERHGLTVGHHGLAMHSIGTAMESPWRPYGLIM